MANNTFRRRAIPRNRSWANSEKTRPLCFVGSSNVVGSWAFFECDHSVERSEQRGKRYAADDFDTVVRIALEAVFTPDGGIANCDAFLTAFAAFHGMGYSVMQRGQIRDCNNDYISVIFDVDVENREVFIITVIAPEAEGLRVAGKRLLLCNILRSDEDNAKVVLSDNRGGDGRILAAKMVENTRWL